MEMVMGIFGVIVGFGEAFLITIILRRRNMIGRSAKLLWQQVGALAAMTGGAFVLAYRQVGWDLLLFHALIFTCFLIVIAAIDFWYGLILQPTIMAMLFAGVVLTGVYLNDLSLSLLDQMIGCSIGGGSLFLLAWGSGKMGYGDAWFAAALGLWLGWRLLFMLLLLAFLGGGIVGLGLLVTGRKKRRDAVPFGPFLAAAAFLVYFYYSDMIVLLGRVF